MGFGESYGLWWVKVLRLQNSSLLYRITELFMPLSGCLGHGLRWLHMSHQHDTLRQQSIDYIHPHGSQVSWRPESATWTNDINKAFSGIMDHGGPSRQSSLKVNFSSSWASIFAQSQVNPQFGGWVCIRISSRLLYTIRATLLGNGSK